MNELIFYLQQLTKPQRECMRSFFGSNKTLVEKLICLLLDEKADKKTLAVQLKTNAGTLNKVCTQAKQELIAEMKKFADNPYGDIYLLKSLVIQGHFVPARKLLFQLEKNFENKQQWQHLELLYIEGARFCQATGDLSLSKLLAARRVKNVKRLAAFIELSADLNNLLFEFEVYEYKKLSSAFLDKLKSLHKKADRCGHFTLIHNALQLQYLFYSRYTNDHRKVAELATAVFKNRKEYLKRLNEIAAVLALNTYANYISLYNGEFTASLVKQVLKDIGLAGKHALFNFYYALSEYYLFEKRFDELTSLMQETETLTDNSKFNVYRTGLLAMRSFEEGQMEQFRKYTGQFYTDAGRLDFPETECFLRILEVLKLLSDKKLDDALYKLNSLRVFIDRNLNHRHIYERNLVSFLTRVAKETVKESEMKSFLLSLSESPYRNIRYLAHQVKINCMIN